MGPNLRDATGKTFGHCLAAASLLLGHSCLTPPSSIAQSATAEQLAASTAATPPPADNHLLGDWGGLRSYLKQNGLDLELSYIGETVGNVTGGAKRGAVYADQVAAQLDVDGGQLIGLPGFGAHVLLINRSGQALSGALGNDQYNANEVFGGGGSVIVHLAYAYVDQTFAGDAFKISAGRMAAGMFFNNSPQIYCNFLNNGDCPVAHALAGGDSSAYTMEPANQWGGVLRANVPAAVYLQVGVFETTPLLGGRSGFDWSTSQDFGTTVPVEIGWEPHLGRDSLPAHFNAGFYYDTSTQPDVLYNVDGTPIPFSGLPPRGDTGHIGVWAAADAMLVRHPTGPDAGLTVFVNYTHADPNISPFQDLVFAGFEDKGLIAARPADGFGSQIIWARQSSQVQKLQEIQSTLGQPLASGVPGPQSTETILEAQYAVHVYRGVDLQPDVQYFIRPAATSVYHSALVLALRLSMQF